MTENNDRSLNRQHGKAPTGILNFDHNMGGGLPRGRTSLLIGGPGSGKTVFALQTLVNGASQYGEPGIFVAFEENAEQVIANAASFGWDLLALQRDHLFFLDARMSLDAINSGNFDLAGLMASLSAKADQIGAYRIVFDSIDVLLMMLENPILERQEIYRIRDWLSETGLTGIITTRFDKGNPSNTERYSFMQFMADCVIQLNHHMDDRVSLRTIRTLKYRGSSFGENELPMIIGSKGIEVGLLEAYEPNYPASTERVSTGVTALDQMLQGGYYRSSSTLIGGAPGTAKSTLCGTFIEAACQRGEKALYISFDESPTEIIRNLRSIGIDLQPMLDSGILHIYSTRSEARSAEHHLFKIKNLIDEYHPQCLAIDPLSAMLKAGGNVAALSMAERLISLTKDRKITLVMSSLLASDSPEVESTPLSISTIADTWLHLSYIAKSGERNRVLTIIKSRGTAHSNQVRELLISEQGVSLRDVYSSGGEVLLGTLRWEKEQEIQTAREKRQIVLSEKRKNLALAKAEARNRIKSIEQEIESLQQTLDQIDSENENFEVEQRKISDGIHQKRHGLNPDGDNLPDPPEEVQ